METGFIVASWEVDNKSARRFRLDLKETRCHYDVHYSTIQIGTRFFKLHFDQSNSIILGYNIFKINSFSIDRLFEKLLIFIKIYINR